MLIYTDGSGDNDKPPYSCGWAFVVVENAKIILENSGFEHGNFITGERLAVIRALQWLRTNGSQLSQFTIYCDNTTVVNHLTGKKRKQHYAWAYLTEAACKLKNAGLDFNIELLNGQKRKQEQHKKFHRRAHNLANYARRMFHFQKMKEHQIEN